MRAMQLQHTAPEVGHLLEIVETENWAYEIVPVALRSVGKGGTVSLTGIHMSPIPEMDYEVCLFHEKVLTSVEASEALVAPKESRIDGTHVLLPGA